MENIHQTSDGPIRKKEILAVVIDLLEIDFPDDDYNFNFKLKNNLGKEKLKNHHRWNKKDIKQRKLSNNYFNSLRQSL